MLVSWRVTIDTNHLQVLGMLQIFPQILPGHEAPSLVSANPSPEKELVFQ